MVLGIACISALSGDQNLHKNPKLIVVQQVSLLSERFLSVHLYAAFPVAMHSMVDPGRQHKSRQTIYTF
jgi:hypothetical protein